MVNIDIQLWKKQTELLLTSIFFKFLVAAHLKFTSLYKNVMRTVAREIR